MISNFIPKGKRTVFLMTGSKRSEDASQHDHCGGTDLTTHPSIWSCTKKSIWPCTHSRSLIHPQSSTPMDSQSMASLDQSPGVSGTILSSRHPFSFAWPLFHLVHNFLLSGCHCEFRSHERTDAIHDIFCVRNIACPRINWPSERAKHAARRQQCQIKIAFPCSSVIIKTNEWNQKER